MPDGIDAQVAAAAPIPLTDLRAQHAPIRDELDEAVGRVLDSGTYVLGQEVEAFESEFAAYCDRAEAVATDSGTSALHLALLALGVSAGDEVVTVAHTFVATVAAIRHAGGRPVLVDTAAGSCTMDPLGLEAAITPRTRVILPVHLYGQCADMDAIGEIAARHRLPVLEDAAQAHGALYRGRRAGSLGDLACFSFYPAKNLGACGEGGAVVTDDRQLAATLRMLRDHGQSARYQHDLIGFNYRMDAVQAAVLRVKLHHLDAWNEARRRLAAEYRRLLAGSVELLAELPYGTPVYHQFPVFHDDREGLRDHLAEHGVSTGIHYPAPVHLQPAYRDLGYGPGDLPQSERSCRRTLSLPFYPEMSGPAVARVAELVREFAASSAGGSGGGRPRAADSLSVCLPAYNEAESIGDVLKEIDALLGASGHPYEIIVCDDGSSDGTGAIAEQFARTAGHARVLQHRRNQGIRATFEELYAEARGDLVLVYAVDGQWPMTTVLALLPLAAGADIVIASRRRKFYGWTRAFVSWGFNLLPHLLFGVATHDAGALKIYRRQALRELPVISRSPFSEAERLIRAARAGYRVSACLVDIKPRLAGRAHGVSLRTVVLALLDVGRVWWDLHARTARRRPLAAASRSGRGE